MSLRRYQQGWREDAEGRTQGPPVWLSDEEAQEFLGQLGDEKDRQLATVREGVKLRWTSGAKMRERCAELGLAVVPAEEDAPRLRELGKGFQLERYPVESGERYQVRLDGAWNAHALTGTPESIIGQIHAYGIPDVEIFEEWSHYLVPDGGEYMGGLVVLLGPNYGTLNWRPLTMPFVLGEPTILGIAGASQADVRNVVRIVRRWKDSETLPLALVFRFGDAAVLGAGLTMPFVLGCSVGENNGYARVEVGTHSLMGDITLGFQLGKHYGPFDP